MTNPVLPFPRRRRDPGRTRAGIALLLVGLLLAACSRDAVGSATTSDSTRAVRDGDVELFDPAVVHDITVDFDADDYDALIAAYADSGEKTWIEATVTIDGVTYERAGLRLKGNSSLRGLGGGGVPGGEAGGDQAGGGEAPGGGFPGAELGSDAPEALPWLIRLDKFVAGQLHQGYADIVVRSNNSTTALNEAVALDLLDDAGLASQLAVSTRFSVNGGDPVLRLAIEHPDDDAWQDRVFDAPGALYKAESTGDWSYRGEDPEAYTDVFDQEGGKKVADLTPLIDLLRFVDEADDATFGSELDDLLDVDSFATYLAMMDLIENFDDIDGPGNNAYLWWDQATGRFTIVPWDMNLAFGAMGAGPGGGAGGPGVGGGRGGFQPPEGFQPPDGFQPPEGFDPGARGGQPPTAGRGGVPGGGLGGDNPLVTRFHANADFEALYQQKLVELRAELFTSGTAEARLDARVETLRSDPTLPDSSTLDQEAEALRSKLTTIAAG